MKNLFQYLPRSRPRIVRMHVIDASGCGEFNHIAVFQCGWCGHKTGWVKVESITEGRRGLPCPNCNKSGESHEK